MSEDQFYPPPNPPAPLPAPLRNDPAYIAYLEERISALEARVPKTELLSQKFTRRAFAVLGHYLFAGILLYAVVLVIGFLIALVFGGLSSF